MSLDTRDRITEGVNPTRLRLETKRSIPSLPVIVLGVIGTLVGAALLFSQLTPTLLKATNEYRVAIDDAYGILEGVDEVRYRGVPAGLIQGIERDGTDLVLVVSLREEYPIYKDARAELRPETPLNDMFLDIIDPGTKVAGELGEDTLSETRTDTSTKINDVLNTLRADERTRLAQLLDNLGNGLADEGRGLRAAVAEFTPFVAQAGVIADELAERETATKRLITNATILTTTLGESETELRTLIRDGSATLGTLQEGSADLDATLAELPPTVSEISSSFAAVRGVVDELDEAVSDLGPVADRLPRGLRTARDLEDDLGPAVRELQQPVQRLVPLTEALRPVTGDLKASVAALRPEVGSIDKATTSVAACEDGIIGFFQWNSSLSKFGDIRGPVPRGNVAFGVPDTGAPGLKTRKAPPNCADDHTIGGRPATKKDEG